MSDIKLVVQGDDLGMCRSVNEGIVLAATDGILTQASVMAPTPWFAEGAAMVQRVGLPVGLHVTLTCEWDYLRWSPLSPAPSLRASDGTFHRTVDAAATADPADAVAEAHAQADRATAVGLDITYIDPHMGVSVRAAYEAMCARFGVKFIYRGHRASSRVGVADRPELGAVRGSGRVARRAARRRSGPARTSCCHTLRSSRRSCPRSTDPANENAVWAEPIRIEDLAALCDPSVRKVIERRDIALVAARDLP